MQGVKLNTIEYKTIRIDISEFMPSDTAVKEMFAAFTVIRQESGFSEQCDALNDAVAEFIDRANHDGMMPVFGRVYMSDVANQYTYLQPSVRKILPCAVSYVQQAPLGGGKMALSLVLQTKCEITNDGWFWYYEHNGYIHFRTSHQCMLQANSQRQIKNLLERLDKNLNKYGCDIASNCLHAWFCIRDIDVNYHGMKMGYKHYVGKISKNTLTCRMSYTCTDGKCYDSRTKVMIDTYCVKGLDEKQRHCLYFHDKPSKPWEVGLSPYSGLYVDYGDRRQVYINGAVGKEHLGCSMKDCNAELQMTEVMANVETFLADADCTKKDIVYAVVYVRDASDYESVGRVYQKMFGQIPTIFVSSAACKPGWLVGMSCIAMREISGNGWRDL